MVDASIEDRQFSAMDGTYHVINYCPNMLHLWRRGPTTVGSHNLTRGAKPK